MGGSGRTSFPKLSEWSGLERTEMWKMGNLQMAHHYPRSNDHQQKAEPLRTQHRQIEDCQEIVERAAGHGRCHGRGNFDRDGQ